MNPVSHDDLRHIETRLGARIDGERIERIDANKVLREDLMGRVDQFHSENRATLRDISSTTNETSKTANEIAISVASLEGKMTGTRSTAMELFKGFGWLVATVLMLLELLRHH